MNTKVKSKTKTIIPKFTNLLKMKGAYEALFVKGYMTEFKYKLYGEYEATSEEKLCAGFIVSNKIESHSKKDNPCLIKIVPSKSEYLSPYKMSTKGATFNNKIDRIIKYTNVTIIINYKYWSKLDNKQKGDFLIDRLPFHFPSRKQAYDHMMNAKKSIKAWKKYQWEEAWTVDNKGKKWPIGEYKEIDYPPVIDLSKLDNNFKIDLLDQALTLIYEK